MITDQTRKEKSKRHFDEIAKDYNKSSDGRYVSPMYQRIIRQIESLERKPETILDLGCGNGNVLSMLVGMTDAHLSGLDFSEEMIHQAKKKLGESAKLQVGDAAHLPYDENSFDVIICNASFHHYTKPIQCLKEIHRVLKKEGVLILGDPTAPLRLYLRLLNWGLKYSNSGDYHIYGKKEIHKLLGANGFEPFHWENVNLRSYILTAKKA